MLTDARGVVSLELAPSWDLSYLPSERPLYAILEEMVKHGQDNPRHGTNCACMDHWSYEITRHVSRAIPPDTGASTDVHWRLDARWRIAHVLGMVERKL